MTIFAKILILISTIDLIETLIAFKWLGAVEANLIPGWYLSNYGLLGLAGLKIWINGLAVTGLELCLTIHPEKRRRIIRGYWAGIIAYFFGYVIPSIILHWEIF